MTVRHRRVVLLLGLLVGLGLLAMLGPALAQASCPHDIDTDTTVSQPVTWDCEVTNIRGDVTVTSAGSLTLDGTEARFHESGLELRVEPGGSLQVESSDLVAVSEGSFQVTLDGASSTMEDALLRPGGGTGVLILSSSPSFDNVIVEDAVTAFDAEEGSEPSFSNVRTSNVVRSLEATGGAEIVATQTIFGSNNRALSLSGDATVVLRESQFDAPTEARLVDAKDAHPRLVLEATAFNESAIEFGEASRNATVETAWFTQIEVEDPDDWIDDYNDVDVRLENRTGDVHHSASPSPETQRTGVLRVPSTTFTAEGTVEAHNPWTITVQKEASAVQEERNVDSADDSVISIALPHETDEEPPEWPGTAGLSSESPEGEEGFASGEVILRWNPAEDETGINHYEVLHEAPSEQIHTLTSPDQDLPLTELEDGSHLFQVRPVDVVGNKGAWSGDHRVTVDSSIPSLSIGITGDEGIEEGYYQSPVIVSAVAKHELFRELRFLESGSILQTNQSLQATKTFTADGEYNVSVQAQSMTGSTTTIDRNFVIDQSAPSLEASLSPASPTGQEGWYDEAPTLRVSATDLGPAGTFEVRYGAEGESKTLYEEPTTIERQGESFLKVEALDRAGNLANTQLALKVDTEPPRLDVSIATEEGSDDAPETWYDKPVRIEAEASDDASGLDRLEYRLNEGTWTKFRTPLTLDYTGDRELEVRAFDEAGNPTETFADTIAIDASPPVAPSPSWTLQAGGNVLVDWSSGPPADTVSGLARAAVELANPSGEVHSKIEVGTEEERHVIGPLQSGEHQFRVAVEDMAGNEASSSWTTLTISDSPIGLTELEEGIARDTETIHYTPPAGFDPVEVVIYVDDRLAVATDEPPYAYEWDTTEHADGPVTVEVLATDENGNQYEERRTYEIKNAYTAVLSDASTPVTAAVAAVLLLVGLSWLGHRTWRGWEIR